MNMKKLFLTIAIAAALIACNSDKEPPDDGYTKAVAARNDSLAKIAAVEKTIAKK